MAREIKESIRPLHENEMYTFTFASDGLFIIIIFQVIIKNSIFNSFFLFFVVVVS
jgi:hypothetical protein